MRQKSAEARKMALELRRQLQDITDPELRKQLSRKMNDLFAEAKKLMDEVKALDYLISNLETRIQNDRNALLTLQNKIDYEERMLQLLRLKEQGWH